MLRTNFQDGRNRGYLSRLCEGVMVGDEERLRAAWNAHYRRLVAAAAAMLGDLGEAEDLVQDVFARAIPAWRRSPPDNPEAWLRASILNEARSRWRRQKRRARLRQLMPPVSEGIDSGTEERMDVLAAVRTLPVAQQAAVVRFYFLDMTVEAIAVEMNRPTGTVKSWLARAREHLAGQITTDLVPLPHASTKRSALDV